MRIIPRTPLGERLPLPAQSHYDPLLGWGHWVAGGIDVHTVPGDHTALFREPAIGRLAKTLEECLPRC